MLKITSSANPKVKRAVDLRELKNRKALGLSLIEGEREILAALEAGVEIQELFIAEKYSNPSVAAIIKKCERGTELYELSANVFQKIAYGEKTEGLVAVGRVKAQRLDDLPQNATALLLVIEAVEKPGNLGAILRSCDGAGVDGIIVCDAATDIYNPNTIRASLGAIFTTRVVMATNEEAAQFLKARKVKMIATSPAAQKPYWKLDAKGAIALVLGSETKGLSPFWLKKADEVLSIPMKGKIDSLNVSVSTAVILYDINRQRSS